VVNHGDLDCDETSHLSLYTRDEEDNASGNLGFIRYNGGLQVDSSSLNVVLRG
jgi:hypothetical protein